jgi:hypothetical protein
MPLLPKIQLNEKDPNGKIVQIPDETGSQQANNTGGFGSPNISYADAKARFRIGEYNRLSNLVTLSTGALLANTEYIKTSGLPQVYDNKTIGIGDIFAPRLNINIVSGDKFETTGFYIPFIPKSVWTPSATIYLYLNSEQLGFSGLGIIQDTVLPIVYEVYGVEATTSFTPVLDRQYLVTGTGTVTWGGNTYRQGEVFVTSTVSTVASGSGTFGVSPLEGSYYNVFQTTYNVKMQAKDLTVSNIRSPQPNGAKYNDILGDINGRLNSISLVDGLGNVSLQLAYDNLKDLSVLCTNLKNGNF